jgi:catechol 2,3-dioxygenase-like lactoylglutathione lyase family enzyme
MKILKIISETVQFEKMKVFYRDILEMHVVKETEDLFTVQAGKTEITFKHSENLPFNHFALRTDATYLGHIFDKLKDNAAELLSEKLGHHSMYWNGKQIYFKDPDGNLVEMLEYENPYNIQLNGWFDVCEIGLPSENVQELSDFLTVIPNQNDLKSDTFRFHGDRFGNFVLVKKGRDWFPTNSPATIHPITVEVEVEGSANQVLNNSSHPYTIIVKG